MPDDDAVPVAEEGGGGFMSGSRGWIIVIAIVVLEGLFFLVLLKYQASNEPANTNTGNDLPQITPKEFMEKTIPLDNLTYSIPMTNGQPMTLAMSLTIVLQKTPTEIQNKVAVTPKDWATFESTIEKMLPMVKDKLYRSINKMSASELETDRGQQDIRVLVQDYINRQLGEMDLDLSSKDVSTNRVQKVLITNYYFN